MKAECSCFVFGSKKITLVSSQDCPFLARNGPTLNICESCICRKLHLRYLKAGRTLWWVTWRWDSHRLVSWNLITQVSKRPVSKVFVKCKRARAVFILSVVNTTTLANHKWHRQFNEAIKTRSKYMKLTQSAGKRVWGSHTWFSFYFWLDECEVRGFLNQSCSIVMQNQLPFDIQLKSVLNTWLL